MTTGRALIDRNRAHLNQHGDYPFEHDANADDVHSYFENPWDTNVRLGIWSGDHLIGRVDLNPIDPPKWVLGYWIDGSFTGIGTSERTVVRAQPRIRPRARTRSHADCRIASACGSANDATDRAVAST